MRAALLIPLLSLGMLTGCATQAPAPIEYYGERFMDHARSFQTALSEMLQPDATPVAQSTPASFSARATLQTDTPGDTVQSVGKTSLVSVQSLDAPAAQQPMRQAAQDVYATARSPYYRTIAYEPSNAPASSLHTAVISRTTTPDEVHVANAPMPSVHYLRPGETMYRISKRYGLSLRELEANNPDLDIHNLSVGQPIQLKPGQVKAPEARYASATPKKAILANAPTLASIPVVKPVAATPSAVTTAAIPVMKPTLQTNDVAPGTGEKLVAALPATLPDVTPVTKPEVKPAAMVVTLGKHKLKAKPYQASLTHESEGMVPRSKPVPETAPTIAFDWPVKGLVISQFGKQHSGLYNDGINIRAPRGAPVRAAADGQVVYAANELEGYGNLIILRHENGWMSAYAHVDEVKIKRGEQVRKGQAIAKIGQTGKVDEPQLHFGIRHGKEPYDPLDMLGKQDYTLAKR